MTAYYGKCQNRIKARASPDSEYQNPYYDDPPKERSPYLLNSPQAILGRARVSISEHTVAEARNHLARSQGLLEGFRFRV